MAAELSQQEKFALLDDVIKEYKDAPGALIPVLHKAQEIFGYLPEEVQERIAEGLNVSLTDIYGVITFYSFFSLKPRGRHKIGVCMGTACYVKGQAQVLQELEKQLGIKINETTEDGKFSLEVTRCVGACGLAPVITIDDDVYGRLTPDRIKEILEKYE